MQLFQWKGLKLRTNPVIYRVGMGEQRHLPPLSSSRTRELGLDWWGQRGLYRETFPRTHTPQTPPTSLAPHPVPRIVTDGLGEVTCWR